MKKSPVLVRKLRELGGCHCITVPHKAVKAFGWYSGKELKVEINVDAKQVIITNLSRSDKQVITDDSLVNLNNKEGAYVV